MFRNALKKGMDFVFGIITVDRIEVTGDQPIEWSNEDWNTFELLRVNRETDPSWRLHSYNPDAWVNLQNMEGGQTNMVRFRLAEGDGDIELFEDGAGIRVRSPDGQTTKVIGIDNSGNLEARDP